MGEGFFVAALTGQRVVDVGQRDQLRPDGNVVACQAVRIAPAIPPLVVPAGDAAGRLQKRFGVEIFQSVEQGRALGGVGLEDGELLRRQAAGLVQYLLVDGDLADVVQGRGEGDVVLLLGREGVFIGLAQQLGHDLLGQDADVADVGAALTVAELHDLAQHIDQHGGVVLLLAGLGRHHPYQTPLLGVEPDGIESPAVDRPGVEGAVDVVGDAPLEGPADDVLGVVAGDHDDRDVLDGVVTVHGRQHIEAVQYRHIDVQQHQCDVARVVAQLLETLFAVGGFQDAEVGPQYLGQQHPVHRGVVGDQDLLAALLGQQGGRGRQHRAGAGHDDGVLVLLGLIHQAAGTVDGSLHGILSSLQYAADAQREMDVRVAGDACGLHPGAYLLEFGSYLLDGAAGQDKQEFVAAVADEDVGLTDAVPDDRRRHLQCQVAGLMAAGVVVDLEIVQVHDGDAEGAFEALHDVLIIAAVEGAGEAVVVELDAVAGCLAHQCFAVLRVDGGAPGGALDELEDRGPALHLIVAGRDVGDVGAAGFQTAGFALGRQRQLGRAVAGEGVLIPAGKADVRPGRVGACAFVDTADSICIQKTDVRIEFAANLETGPHLFSRHRN